MGISKADNFKMFSPQLETRGELQAVARDHVQPDAPDHPGWVWLVVGRLSRAWGD